MINTLSQLILIWNLCRKKIKILIILAPLLSVLAAFCEAQNIILLKPIVVILISENSNENMSLEPVFLFLFISILTSLLKSSSQFLNINITTRIGADLPVLVFRKLLNLPYSRFSTIGSGSYIDIVNVKVANIVRGIINPFFQLFSSLITMAIVIFYLLKTEFFLTITLIFLISLAYSIIVFFSRKRINRMSKKIAVSSKYMSNVIYESLNNLREIKLINIQDNYVGDFKENSSKYWKFYGLYELYSALPRYFLEGVILSLVALLLIFSSQINSSLTYFVASLSTISLGLQRLLPRFQNLYDTYVSINAFKEDLFAFVVVLNDLEKKSGDISSKTNFIKIKDFAESNLLISMENIDFRYEGMNKNEGFRNLQFKLYKNDIISITGPSGSGKTTFLDILSNLLNPLKGKIFISKDLFENEKYKFSYVSQQDFLFNNSIAYNITLKEADDLTNKEINRVKKTLKIVELDSTIRTFKNGIRTMIGEKGDLLSGGQKQRLSIARALFNDPKLLILDEATGRLDKELESKVLNNLTLLNDITIVLVTHDKNPNTIANKKISINNWKLSKR